MEQQITQSLKQEFVEAFQKVSGKARTVADDGKAIVAVLDLLAEYQPKVFAVAPMPSLYLDTFKKYAKSNACEMLGPEYAPDALPLALDPAEIGITFAQFGIAETGTLVEVVRDDAHRLVSAMPRIHIALLYARDLVPTLKSAASSMRQIFEEHGEGVAVSFISGPSRTGDIEMILTLGVHGPETAHVIIVGEDT